MKARTVAWVLALAVTVYIVLAGIRAWVLVRTGDPVLVLFGIAVVTGAFLPAALGGAAGGAGVIAAGWIAAGALAQRSVVPLRRGLGAVVLVVAAVLALRATGRI